MNSLLLNVICVFAIANTNPNAERAQQSLDALYKNYAAPNTCLLHENYPSDQNNKATYLASEEQAKRHNEYSYLWPYSGTFSAVNALLESTGNKKYKENWFEVGRNYGYLRCDYSRWGSQKKMLDHCMGI